MGDEYVYDDNDVISNDNDSVDEEEEGHNPSDEASDSDEIPGNNDPVEVGDKKKDPHTPKRKAEDDIEDPKKKSENPKTDEGFVKSSPVKRFKITLKEEESGSLGVRLCLAQPIVRKSWHGQLNARSQEQS